MPGVTQAQAVPAAAVEEPAGGPEPRAGVASLSGRCERLPTPGCRAQPLPGRQPPDRPHFALFQLIGWPGRRILPGEARESLRNALTSGSVQPRARAHLHTRAHSCTPVHPCTSPISRTLHPSHTPQAGRLISYTPTTQAHSGIHGASPHATRDSGGWKARFAERERERESLSSKLA